MNSTKNMINHVLFDLDGTLVDTAPNLGHALNRLLRQYHKDPLPAELIRGTASRGSVGLIKLGFNIDRTDPQFLLLQEQFLHYYDEDISSQSSLFPQMNEVLDYLKQHQYQWGIVTNKPERYTRKLLKDLKLLDIARCVISGDSLEYRKPHPAPLLQACKLMNCPIKQTIYIGDALNDVQAARNAGMLAMVARYGYIHSEENPMDWTADFYIDSPLEIVDWLKNN